MPPSLAELILTTPSSATALPPIQLSQLELDALSDEDGLNTALDLLQAYTEQHRERLDSAIDKAMEVKGLFEWLVSSTFAAPSLMARGTDYALPEMSERSFTTLRYHILKEFPESSVEVFLSSISRRLMAHLDTFFAYVALPYDPANTRLAEQNQAQLSVLLPVLEALERCCADGTDNRAAMREAVSFMSSTPFDRAGYDVPRALADAWKLAKRTLSTLKQVMRVRSSRYSYYSHTDVADCQTYLTLLREGSLAETIRAVIHSSLSQHQLSIQTDTLAPSSDATSELPLAHKKAVIVLDTVEGFGPYRIAISTRMIHHMRGSRSRPRLFARINKKLRYV